MLNDDSGQSRGKCAMKPMYDIVINGAGDNIEADFSAIPGSPELTLLC
jgi:hypothetical protein